MASFLPAFFDNPRVDPVRGHVNHADQNKHDDDFKRGLRLSTGYRHAATFIYLKVHDGAAMEGGDGSLVIQCTGAARSC